MEYTYKVSGVKVYDTDTQKDVVKEATFHIIGTKDGKSYDSFLPMEFAEPSGSFTEFDDLTSDQVLEWLKSVIGDQQLTDLKEGLAAIPGSWMETVTRDRPIEKALKE
jgi:hypothetical protein